VRAKRGAAVLALALVLAGLSGCDSSDSSGDRATMTRESVTVVAQNLLHGIACPDATDRCMLPKRVELFARQLTEARCPQVVAVEEADPVMAGLLGDQASKICAGRYKLVGGDDPAIDREVVLTTLPVLGSERVHLAGPLRTALWLRVRAALGQLDVVATHLASGSDDRPCDRTTCPPPCKSDDSLNTCQGRQAAQLLADRSGPASVGLLVGDLNAKPDEPTIKALTSRGYLDTFLAAGNSECDPATGAGCTSGRQDMDLSDLTNPASRQSERIDYIFLATKRDCRAIDFPGLFAADPASPPLDGLVFASDHTGVQAKISCVTTAADRAAARRVAARPTTTTTKAAEVGAETKAAITKAFETVFNGGGDLETRLAALQDAEQLRDSFIARFEDPATKAVVDQVRVRIDSMQQLDNRNVNVVYSILLDQAEALGHLPGSAVRVGDRWLVSRKSYCQVATLGQSTVPGACK
jgi:endonuclease/exonuclease/phosphatase family metal-dependent hydrolase